MSSESETDIDDDIFELACNYKLTGKYPKDCPSKHNTKTSEVNHFAKWRGVEGTKNERKDLDFVGPISPISTSRNRYILTLSDQFSKWVEAVAVPTKEAHRVASELYKIFMRMGLPNVLTTDNGSEFRNKMNAAMLKKLGIRHSFITPYNPQSNGLDERYNQTLQSMLSKAVMGHKEMWDEFIDSAVFAYNTSTHESTTYSPFEVMFGRKARLPVEADLRPIPSNYDSRLAHAPNTFNQMAQVAKERQEILKDVKHNILAAQAKQKQHYDAKHTRAKLFDVGVQVLKKNFLRSQSVLITIVASPFQSVHTQSLRSFLTPSLESVLTPTFQSAFTHSLQSVYATAFQSVYTTAFQSVYTTAFQSVYTTAFQSVYTTAFQSINSRDTIFCAKFIAEKRAGASKFLALLKEVGSLDSQVALAGIGGQMEVGSGLGHDARRTRPADVLVSNWVLGKPAAFDITVTSPLTPITLHEASVTSGSTAQVAESRKHASNDAKCSELGCVCVPLAVEAYGCWPEAQTNLSRLAARLAIRSNCCKSQATLALYGRLNLVLVRANARALLSRSMATGC
eukprot:Em0001g2828a